MSTTVRDVVVAQLRARGMTTVFGNPGSTELPMFRDFPDDFDYVLGLQESVVVGMADGFAQASGTAALVNLHSAAGVGHAMGNLFTAWRNRTPLVVTAGQQARSLLVGEPFLMNERATELPRPYVKWSCEPARPQDVPAAFARAYHVAMTPPRGPVFLSIPVDDWEVPAEPGAEPRPRPVGAAARPDPDLVAGLVTALDRAVSPALVVGAEVDRDHAFAEVVALAERHRARVWTAPLSPRCGFPEDHPLYAGFLPAARETIRERLAGHDLVVVLGAPVFTFHVEGRGPLLPAGCVLFQVVEDPDTAAWTPEGTALVGGVRATVTEVLAASAPPARSAPPGRPRPARLTAPAELTEAFLLQTLADERPESAIVVEEAPSTRAVMQERLPFTGPETFFTCASGGLGHGMPAAVGVALARPGQRVIALLGDGSSMYAVQALWSAAHENTPVTFVVVNNGGYAALDGFAAHFGIDKPVGTAVTGIDYAGLARDMGCAGVTVQRPAELADALRRALTSSGPVLLDVHVR
ncbi:MULTISPECIES: benzoylformate decarboxylase [Pseudonocardia]|uniref:benzoylformate decarboxylase n=1 Tax=Pseudonocardia TaxID=1847 RepID=UPI000916942D|nr:benzoylformate decarboxylase [Pseudonocardia sp. SID8383]OJG06784.1 Benzoylformate decarboxylase [Pseudonocardia autotrophica]